ncbi:MULTISPECIES: DUF6776 family protein [Rhodanobacteraceae]|uniref:DUF6776 family protein n=1 Tax=Rhodanobacteraceae TaxID=1775411 RepID=UPI0008853ADA|nr:MULTISPECIES: DUF6776 family protein [Rhodanobacteraceae]SDG14838.1 hypothetical protein SAMN04515659_2247 [Dyella sp. 333MFSha]SKB86277.1 hypothetical protein SAMN05660880_02979 [Luteibacter sp. 22Crub2.1]
MAPSHPPRFVVRRLDDMSVERRKRLLMGAAWLGSLLLTALVTWSLTAGRAPAGTPGHGRIVAHETEAEDLRQQVANLQRAGQVSEIAARELKRNLAERDEEISGLRTDLAFYSRLVGGNGQRDGLKIQGTRTTAIKGTPNAWNVMITLTQNARRGDEVKGDIHLAVEGIQDNKVRTLEGAALGQAASVDGLPFAFRYFQQIQGSFTLPAGFQPTRLRLEARPAGDDAVSATVAWADATRNDEASDVQQ